MILSKGCGEGHVNTVVSPGEVCVDAFDQCLRMRTKRSASRGLRAATGAVGKNLTECSGLVFPNALEAARQARPLPSGRF